MTPLFVSAMSYILVLPHSPEDILLVSYLKRHKGSIVLATISSLLLGLVSTLLFSLIGPALQLLLAPGIEFIPLSDLFGDRFGQLLSLWSGISSVSSQDLWSYLPVLILLLGVLRATFMASGWFLWERASELIAAAMREGIMRRYLHLDPSASYNNDGFDQSLSSILTSDIRLTREYIVHFYGGLPRELIQTIFYLISLYLLSPELFLIFMLGVMPAGLIISRLGKKIRKRSANALENFSQLSEWLQQRFLGVETIKQLRTESAELAQMEALTTGLNGKFLKTIRVKARTAPLLEITAVAAMSLVLLIALEIVAEGRASGAVLMSFFSILGILSQSATKLGRYYNSNKEGGAAIERIEKLNNFMDQNQAKQIAMPHHGDDCLIRLQGVGLRYPGQDQEALKDINLEFKKGRVYCLVGPSGAGKSSLFSILLGLIEPTEGAISYSQGLDRQNIGYLPQVMHLAPSSLGENICYPHGEVDQAKAEQALANSAAGELKAKLNLDLSQSSLSGGQAQRVFLARLFYHDFSIVLIDEGTSAIDPENEALIYQSIRQLAQSGATVIMIAHRQSGIKMADEMVRLENGQIVEV